MSTVSTAQDPLDLDKLFLSLSAHRPNAVKRKIFEALTGLEYDALDVIWLRQGNVPAGLSLRATVTKLSTLLGLRSKEVATMLGVSESRMSRNDKVTLSVLDRAEGVSDIFASVSAVLGFADARDWFKRPNPGLGGAAPYTLLETHYGQKKVENLITSLLNGAVV